MFNQQNQFENPMNSARPANEGMAVKIMIFIFCIFSLLANIFVITKYLRVQYDNRTYFSRIIFLISITNFFWTITQIVSFIVGLCDGKILEPDYKKGKAGLEFLCDLQGFTQTMYFIGTFYWMTYLIFSVYKCCVKGEKIYKNKPLYMTRRDLILQQIFIFSLSTLPIMTGSFDAIRPYYGEDCFIIFYNSKFSDQQSFKEIAGTVERSLVLLIPFPLIVTFYIYTLLKVRKTLFKSPDSDQVMLRRNFISEEDKKYFLKVMFLFPAVLILCWTLLYLCRLMETLNVTYFTQNDTLFRISYALISIEGFFNALVYGMDIRYVFSQQKASYDWPGEDKGQISLQENDSNNYFEKENQKEKDNKNNKNQEVQVQ